MIRAVNRRSFLLEPTRQGGRRSRVRMERRAEILSAAARIFGEKGYHGASIAEIAEAAEYGTGTIYLHFENKEDLYVALMEGKMLELAQRVHRRVGKGAEPWEAVRNAVAAQLEFYEQNRTFFQSFVRERLEMQARLQKDKWVRVTRAYEQFIRYLARLLRQGQHKGAVRSGDSRRLAVALSGMVNQLTRDGLRRSPGRSLAAQTEFVIELFQHGAQTPATVPSHESAN